MEFSNRVPKEKRFGKPNKNARNKFIKKDFLNTNNTVYKRFDNLTHPELREFQRYGTLSANRKEITDAICKNNAITIKQDDDTITALVRNSNRYYIAVMDIDKKVIKTFLPENSCDFLHYVQKFIDKENSQINLLAA